jgi:hypothetical protein
MKNKTFANFIVNIFLVSLVIFSQSWSLSAEYKYYSRGKRDPFVPLVTGQIKATSLGLQFVETIEDIKFEGVILDPSDKSIAVLNGELVKEGEKMYNVEIVKIYSNAVTLKIYDKVYTINLMEEGGERVEK